MFFFADMLWENSDFIGNSYPPEVCGAILRSMEKLSRIKSEGVITGMTPSEFSVLCCAEQFPRKHGGTAASVADIAALMGVSVPAVSRTLRSLQGRGWIERTIDEDDRRSVRVSITPAGREKLLDNMSRVAQPDTVRVHGGRDARRGKTLLEVCFRNGGAARREIEKAQ